MTMKPQSPFHIDGTEIAPGQSQKIRLKVARLPSGTRIYLHAFVSRSPQPGPCILVLGGVHGDEVNGVEIVRRSLAEQYFSQLACGSAIVIPLLNIYGFINFSRDVPDGKDVNRSFPGRAKGSLASRVAYILRKHILPHVDIGLDFHCGGASRYNYPQIRYTKGDTQSEALAHVFNAPFYLPSNPIKGSLRETAGEKDIAMLVFEGGETRRLDGYSIQVGLAGIQRVLHHLEMRAHPEPQISSHHLNKNKWVRATRSGMFLWQKPSGMQVTPGEVLGYIHDPYGTEKTPIVSNRAGYIIGHNNAPVVNQGDALFHIAEPLS